MNAALIKRLEDAAEGTQELSAEIARDVVGHKIHDWPLWIETKSRMHDFSALAPCPAYTTSLDDAVTLVPKYAAWHVGTDYELPGHASIYQAGITSDDCPRRYEARASTPVLALCAAALKAMEQT